ncbi:MAG TPA: C40 family peptidase [Gaiellaceae bacterium]|jgi:cell wall-associated NlpC family hydrolase
MLGALAAAGVLAVAPPQWASVRVPVANVWATPGAGHLPLDPHVWPTSAVTYSQRLALVGHMLTQVLYGERVRVLGRRAGWTRIAVPDQPSPLDRRGYPGWVLSWQLVGPLRRASASVTVTVRTSRLANGAEVSFGTRLPLLRRVGKVVEVTTPVGVTWLPAAAVAPLRESLVASARRFLGLRYLWGGLSAWGYDCSGLTWAVYRAHGITIPRDADAQFAAGAPVTTSAVRPGDLVFYGVKHVHHVAMAVGNGLMIESPNSASAVRIVPIRSADRAGVRRFPAK